MPVIERRPIQQPGSRRPFARSWELLKESYRFLNENKDLLILPIISLLATFTLLALMLAAGVTDALTIQPVHMAIIVGIVIFIIGYFILSFVVLLLNSALIACAAARLQGQSLSISGGIAEALKHIKSLLLWCLISVTIGQLISFIESSHRVIGRVVAMIIGFAWVLCTYFVVPMLILDDLSPVAAVKKSAHIFGKKWRGIVSATALLGLIFFVLLGLWMLALLHLPTQKTLLLEVGLPLLILFFITMSVVGSALNAIVRSALYLKMVRNITPQNFDHSLLDKMLIPTRSVNRN
ncbi:MAG: hypothetical protein GY821_15580 [Gammaproteobacteria bacterium]|nr:hypothetical protein [Gammaproteobacteria bacterium]